LTSKKDWDAVRRDVKPIYSAPNPAAARSAFEDFADRWGSKYPATVRLWDNAWQEFIPFLDYDVEIRRVLCSTNAIESLNARYRRAIKARGHFPTEQAALKCLYLVTRSLDPTGTGQARWAVRWKPALNAFSAHRNRRCSPGLNPPVSSSDLAMVCRTGDYADRRVNWLVCMGSGVGPVSIIV
jgi:transposase-like protein